MRGEGAVAALAGEEGRFGDVHAVDGGGGGGGAGDGLVVLRDGGLVGGVGGIGDTSLREGTQENGGADEEAGAEEGSWGMSVGSLQAEKAEEAVVCGEGVAH